MVDFLNAINEESLPFYIDIMFIIIFLIIIILKIKFSYIYTVTNNKSALPPTCSMVVYAGRNIHCPF